MSRFRNYYKVRKGDHVVLFVSDRVKTAQALGAGAYVKKPYVIEKLETGREE